MQLSDIRTRQRRKLDELTENFWDDDDLDDYTNESYLFYWQWLLEALHPVILKPTSPDLNIVADTDAIALPSDYIFARLVERVYDNYTVPLYWDERFEGTNYTSGSADTYGFHGYNPSIRFVGTNLIIEPTPSTSITGGIRMDYAYIPGRLSADTDEPVGPLKDLYVDLLINRGVIKAKEKEEMISGGGTSISSIIISQRDLEQTFKESIELPTSHRSYSKPFGLGGYC